MRAWNLIAIAFTPYMLLVCLLGVTLGILWGAMPGLSTTMAMALLIGLSAGMDQHIAIMEPAWRNPKHRAQWRMTLEVYAKPLRGKRVNQITTADVLEVLGRLP